MPRKKAKTTKSTNQTKTVKKQVKKITRRRRKISAPPVNPNIIIGTEQVYQCINRVQLARETIVFKVLQIDSAVIDNILKDLCLPFKKKDIFLKKEKQMITEYTVDPPIITEKILNFDKIDEFTDEILEDGQLFF